MAAFEKWGGQSENQTVARMPGAARESHLERQDAGQGGSGGGSGSSGEGKMSQSTDWITQAEAARRLGTSEQTIRRRTKRGMPSRKSDGAVQWPAALAWSRDHVVPERSGSFAHRQRQASEREALAVAAGAQYIWHELRGALLEVMAPSKCPVVWQAFTLAAIDSLCAGWSEQLRMDEPPELPWTEYGKRAENMKRLYTQWRRELAAANQNEKEREKKETNR